MVHAAQGAYFWQFDYFIPRCESFLHFFDCHLFAIFIVYEQTDGAICTIAKRFDDFESIHFCYSFIAHLV